MVGAIARETQHNHGTLTCTMVIDCKTLETSFLLKQEGLFVLVTYLDEGQAGVEIMVVTTVKANGML